MAVVYAKPCFSRGEKMASPTLIDNCIASRVMSCRVMSLVQTFSRSTSNFAVSSKCFFTRIPFHVNALSFHVRSCSFSVAPPHGGSCPDCPDWSSALWCADACAYSVAPLTRKIMFGSLRIDWGMMWPYLHQCRIRPCRRSNRTHHRLL